MLPSDVEDKLTVPEERESLWDAVGHTPLSTETISSYVRAKSTVFTRL